MWNGELIDVFLIFLSNFRTVSVFCDKKNTQQSNQKITTVPQNISMHVLSWVCELYVVYDVTEFGHIKLKQCIVQKSKSNGLYSSDALYAWISSPFDAIKTYAWFSSIVKTVLFVIQTLAHTHQPIVLRICRLMGVSVYVKEMCIEQDRRWDWSFCQTKCVYKWSQPTNKNA